MRKLEPAAEVARPIAGIHTHGLPTVSAINDALVFAAEKNQRTMHCEAMFARKAKANPHVMDARLGRMRYVCGLIGVKRGAVLLDIGAGVGVNSVLALLCGVEEIHAVEYEGTRFDSAKLIVEFLGLQDRVHCHFANVLTDFDLPENSLDGAFSFELLEHIADTARLYGNLARWIRPKGRIYSRTGANGRNVTGRRGVRAEWDLIDTQSYAPIRERLIREVEPGIASDALRTLVARTRGDLIDQVRQVALDYRRNRVMPPPKPPCAPRNPVTAEYMERRLDPYANIDVMDAQGFKTSLLRPNFENMTIVNPFVAAGLRIAGRAIAATHPASLFVAPWLEFLSERSGPAASAAVPAGGTAS